MNTLQKLTDDVLLENTYACARNEREKTALLVAHLAEVERRGLAKRRGFQSTLMYARESLGLSDFVAWERVTVAKLSLKVPEVIERLSSGELSLGAACSLYRTIVEVESPKALPVVAPVEPMLPLLVGAPPVPSPGASQEVAPEEGLELLKQVAGKSRHETERALGAWQEERTGEAPKVRRSSNPFNLSDEHAQAFDRLRDLLSHRLGTRDPQAVLVWMLGHCLEELDPVRKEARIEKRKAARARAVAEAAPEAVAEAAPEAVATAKGALSCDRAQALRAQAAKPASAPKRRRLPAALKRQIWIRDRGECQHTDPKTGRQCKARAFLDYDHFLPLSKGGTDDINNIYLACSGHNRSRVWWPTEDQPLRGPRGEGSGRA